MILELEYLLERQFFHQCPVRRSLGFVVWKEMANGQLEAKDFNTIGLIWFFYSQRCLICDDFLKLCDIWCVGSSNSLLAFSHLLYGSDSLFRVVTVKDRYLANVDILR
ncbi:hypothetical protein AVEN_138937-1 [Araneus ventricosus]|uniref:Uncharacterized protein n=1 Tax=Araneus ventricosus TaxID=182803 RepID=A0A4Y2PEJ7_ARAVE|nr:hypothetical protein AVEN_241595-1 [Araneus ventricosus]GBN48649.1 hypothetical protein AVEN_257748-1 [Araneus ventricosus]GBN48673.1 hypothetical protein AVEN_39954-1 [Araneus ventricosus]GBN48727.1 hypothetical protein AVEN_138937-1 [Araneus ventricosus]